MATIPTAVELMRGVAALPNGWTINEKDQVQDQNGFTIGPRFSINVWEKVRAQLIAEKTKVATVRKLVQSVIRPRNTDGSIAEELRILASGTKLPVNFLKDVYQLLAEEEPKYAADLTDKGQLAQFDFLTRMPTFLIRHATKGNSCLSLYVTTLIAQALTEYSQDMKEAFSGGATMSKKTQEGLEEKLGKALEEAAGNQDGPAQNKDINTMTGVDGTWAVQRRRKHELDHNYGAVQQLVAMAPNDIRLYYMINEALTGLGMGFQQGQRLETVGLLEAEEIVDVATPEAVALDLLPIIDVTQYKNEVSYDVYLDISGSMSSPVKISRKFTVSTLNVMAFLITMLHKLGYVHRMFLFDDQLFTAEYINDQPGYRPGPDQQIVRGRAGGKPIVPISLETVQCFGPMGGTAFHLCYNHIMEHTRTPSLIISDGASSLTAYTDLITFLIIAESKERGADMLKNAVHERYLLNHHAHFFLPAEMKVVTC